MEERKYGMYGLICFALRAGNPDIGRMEYWNIDAFILASRLDGPEP